MTEEIAVTQSLASLYLKQGYWAEARQAYESLLRRNPGDEKLMDGYARSQARVLEEKKARLKKTVALWGRAAKEALP